MVQVLETHQAHLVDNAIAIQAVFALQRTPYNRTNPCQCFLNEGVQYDN
jgi:hypothetical protein